MLDGTSLWFLRFHSIFKTSTSFDTLSDTIHLLPFIPSEAKPQGPLWNALEREGFEQALKVP